MKILRNFRLPNKTLALVALGLISISLPAAETFAQSNPIRDSLKVISLRNDKRYRLLSTMEDKGASYEFTNVTTWRITDLTLRDQLISIYTAQYGNAELKNFEINPEKVFIFSAPVQGTDRFEPFHILFMGHHVAPVDTSGGGSGEDAMFGGGRRRAASTEDVAVAFKGRQVIPLMRRQPTLVDNINAVQGEIVELPGDIMPRGVQLIKNSTQRYVFHQMFTGFYSKRQIIDEQHRALNLPTLDEQFQIDSTAPVIPTDVDQSAALPDEQLNSRAFRYDKTVDLSIDHLNVNISRNNALELQLGNPEVGLPFWTSGEGRFWLDMKNQIGTESDFKIGVAFPANLGRSDALTFNARKLSGFFGGSVEAYFAGIDFFSAFNMPIQFSFTVIPAAGYNSSIIYNGGSGTMPYAGQSVPVNETFYRTSFIGQISIPIILQLDPANFLQFVAGVGVHNVKQSWIPNDAEAQQFGLQSGKLVDFDGNVSVPFTPHVAIEYVNHRSNKFGLNFQYDHLFTFGTWLELIPDHLRIEGSYTTPLIRNAKPYEPSNFFEITPRIYF